MKGYRRIVVAWLASLVHTGIATAQPIPDGSTELEAPVTIVRAAQDNSRVLVWLEGRNASLPKLVLLNAKDRTDIKRIAELATDDIGTLAISADAKLALIAIPKSKPKYNTASQWIVRALDLTLPGRITQVWQRELSAYKIALASDASAYAALLPPQQSDSRRSLQVAWTRSQLQKSVQITSYGDPADFMISDGGNYVGLHSYGSIDLFNMTTELPMHYSSSYIGRERFQCMLDLLPNGHAIMQDSRTERIGVYTASEGVPRVNKITVSGTGCGDKSLVNDKRLFVRNNSALLIVDKADPRNPKKLDQLTLDPTLTPLAQTYSDLYVVDTQRRVLQMLPIKGLMDATIPIDWVALERSYDQEMEKYQVEKATNKYLAPLKFRWAMEKAGILLAINAEPSGVPPRKVAAMFNDYGYLLGTGPIDFARASQFLRRSIAIDPSRRTAYLNLADLLKSNLGTASNWDQKLSRRNEAVAAYKRYISLGGKPDGQTLAFMSTNLPKSVRQKDWCSAIAELANGGKLSDFVSNAGFDISIGQNQIDIQFTTEGTAHVPAIYAVDSNTDMPKEVGMLPDWEESLWGGDQLGLLSYGGQYHILHYRDFAHPVSSTSLADNSSCSFTSDTNEVINEGSEEPALCKKLLDGLHPDDVDFSQEAWITQKEITERYSQTYPRGVRKFSFTNDNADSPVIKLQLSSSAGPGCDSTFFDLLDRNAAKFSEQPPRDLLINMQGLSPTSRYVSSCGNDPRFFEYQNKVYFESRPKIWPPVDRSGQYHFVRSITRNKIINSCDFGFTTKVTGSSTTREARKVSDE